RSGRADEKPRPFTVRSSTLRNTLLDRQNRSLSLRKSRRDAGVSCRYKSRSKKRLPPVARQKRKKAGFHSIRQQRSVSTDSPTPPTVGSKMLRNWKATYSCSWVSGL